MAASARRSSSAQSFGLAQKLKVVGLTSVPGANKFRFFPSAAAQKIDRVILGPYLSFPPPTPWLAFPGIELTQHKGG